MGEVWLARDTQLDRAVAIKVLPSEVRGDPSRLKRFRREARVAAKLNHPNTVTVYHVGEDGDILYVVMEYVDGESLEQYVNQFGPMNCRFATQAILHAAAGLARAHDHQLVHRDIKPANLLRASDGNTKVADFGLARDAHQHSELTQLGSTLGTPCYMAPEQWSGDMVDARSDLYSLMCTYYFLLTGAPPFDAPNPAVLGYQHRHEPFPDIRVLVPDIPESICGVLARGASKQPVDRYQTAHQLIEDLHIVGSIENATPAAAGSIVTPRDDSLPGESSLATGRAAWSKIFDFLPRDVLRYTACALAIAIMTGVFLAIERADQAAGVSGEDKLVAIKNNMEDPSRFDTLFTKNTVLELTDDSDSGKLLGITVDLRYDAPKGRRE